MRKASTSRAGWRRTSISPDDAAGYLIWHREAPAGFAFVFGLSGELHKMGDFFIVRAARRQGVGHEVVEELFARYRGRWEIGFQGNNRGVPEFWRRVVAAAVGTDWAEERRPVPDKPHIADDPSSCSRSTGPRLMFSNSAHVYDAVYSFKDYAAESARIQALIEERSPGAATLLDVACGTGKHLEQLRAWYEVSGLDLDPQLLEIAQDRLGVVELHQRDMTSFSLGRRSTWSRACSARSATSARSNASAARSPRWRRTSVPAAC